MKKNYYLLLVALSVSAQSIYGYPEDNDSVRALDEVVVEAQLQSTSATVSTYIPTSKQKNSSQTGTDLLNRMAIPQLALGMGGSVTTNTGAGVDIFIDYLPASEQDLTGMRMADVKKVEYYDFPEDPRFLGKPHVVNFIMQQYEYGGYVKATSRDFFIANSGDLSFYSKVQYKKMTYDIAFGGYYMDNGHNYTNTVETYRLPQADGSLKQFERISVTDNATLKRQYFWPTFKALYRTDKISMSNIIGATVDNYPTQNSTGSVYFMPDAFPRTDFVSTSDNAQSYISYKGYWNFILPHENTINFSPYYSFSHTKQHSRYTEADAGDFYNSASDNSHMATGTLRFQHEFGKKGGDLTIAVEGSYTNSRTRYGGTATANEGLSTLRVGPEVSYNYSTDNFYGTVGIGFTYDRSKLSIVDEKHTQPSADLSVQYAFSSKHSLNAEAHYSTSMPSLSYRSSAVVQSNPLMRYTGNPGLTSSGRYNFTLSYQWMPNNKFSFSAFAYGSTLNKRYAYQYEASSEGILRTVKQPVGKFLRGNWGLLGNARLLKGNLQISGQIAQIVVRSGEPYDWNKSHINWYLQAFYYHGAWYFGGQYQAGLANPDGSITGAWITGKDSYAAIVGWGNSRWNLQMQLLNAFRWNWHSETYTMQSQYYDATQYVYNPNNHCFVFVSATYTLGFGKKIAVGNEATQVSGAGNAILK